MCVPLLKGLYGKNWQTKAVLPAYLYKVKRYYKKPSKERIVMIGGVFPDPDTRGIDNLAGSIVENFNGEKILNLQDLRQRVLNTAKAERPSAKLTLYNGQPLYLNIKERDALNQRILKKYAIPQASVWDK